MNQASAEQVRRGRGLLLCGLSWVGFALALRLLDRFPLREDEAIYGYWALHFWHVDPYFLQVWPDKPPLFLWTLALFLQLGGASQASGRLLNIMLTLLTALVVGATARRLWGQRSGVVATALYLLNPFALSFAATIYTDPLLVLAGQLALFWALSGRSLSAGLWLGVAIMTKQQGVLYLPLIGLALWLQPTIPNRTSLQVQFSLWLRFVAGITLVAAPIIYWDSTRWAVAPSPWDLGVRNYGVLHLAAPTEWLPRLAEWAKLLWYLTASWPVWLLFAGSLLAALLLRRITLSPRSAEFTSRPNLITRSPDHAGPPHLPALLALWGGGFLALHLLSTVQLWDRYLLPLAPLLCLLVAWAFTHICRCSLAWWQRGRQWRIGVGLVSLLCLAPPALTAANGGLPIGGDHGAYNGLPQVLAWLQQHAPNDAVLYHQRLGWHYQFYLFDAVTRGAYDLRWFANPTYLAANAAQTPNRPRFLVLPDWAPQPDLLFHLATRRLRLIPTQHVGRMTLYTIETQAQAACVWCLCTKHSPWPIWSGHHQQGESLLP